MKQAAAFMGVSVRSVYLAGELLDCRPDLAARCEAGELTLREALRMAKPEKYAKRDKVDQWLAQYRVWSPADRERAVCRLADLLEELKP